MPDSVDTRDVDARLIWESKEFCDDEVHWAARRKKARQQLERKIKDREPTEAEIEKLVHETIEKAYEAWYADMKIKGLVR